MAKVTARFASVTHVTLAVRPYRRWVDDESVVHLPAPRVYDVPGTSVVLDLPVSGPDWCWEIDERMAGGKKRYVVIEEDGDLDYTDLVDVNPLSFDPEVDPEPSWWAALDALQSTVEGIEQSPGVPGEPGEDGADGQDGKSAYQSWLDLGNEGTELQFIASLKGEPGADGQGGADGKSAYDLAVDNGYVGTESAWLLSLKGADGADGADGSDGAKGDKGDTGDPGVTVLTQAEYDLITTPTPGHMYVIVPEE